MSGSGKRRFAGFSVAVAALLLFAPAAASEDLAVRLVGRGPEAKTLASPPVEPLDEGNLLICVVPVQDPCATAPFHADSYVEFSVVPALSGKVSVCLTGPSGQGGNPCIVCGDGTVGVTCSKFEAEGKPGMFRVVGRQVVPSVGTYHVLVQWK